MRPRPGQSDPGIFLVITTGSDMDIYDPYGAYTKPPQDSPGQLLGKISSLTGWQSLVENVTNPEGSRG